MPRPSRPEASAVGPSLSTRALEQTRRAAAVAARDQDLLLRDLEEWVNAPTPTSDRDGLDRFARRLGEVLGRYGFSTDLVESSAGLHVHASLTGSGQASVALLCHHDTVAPPSASRDWETFRRSSDKAFGLGVADMKGGIVVAAHCGRLLADGARPFARLELVSVPDEEIRTSQPPHTLDRLTGYDAVLCLECGGPDGSIVSERKAARWVRLSAAGRASHAGVAPDAGRNAITDLCRSVLDVARLDDARPGLSLQVTKFNGGENVNSVPSGATAILDLRAPRAADIDWALAEIRTSASPASGLMCEDLGGPPPLRRDDGVARLAHAALALGEELGETFHERATGGVSDASWTASLGIPTLDGLGPWGGNDHSVDEYIDIHSLATRCGIVAGLVTAIDDDVTSKRHRSGDHHAG